MAFFKIIYLYVFIYHIFYWKGVGGWASKGVDPAIYARALMEGARKYANTHMNVFDPILVMEAG